MFKRGRGENSAGVRVSDLHIMHVISTFLLAVAVYIFLICMLHIVAYPVSKVAHGDVVEMASVENLDQFLRRWKLSKGKLLVMFFGALVVGMLFMARGPASSFGNRVIPLPVSVVAGAELPARSEEHTSELQSRGHLVCRLLLEKKNTMNKGCVLLAL